MLHNPNRVIDSFHDLLRLYMKLDIEQLKEITNNTSASKNR